MQTSSFIATAVAVGMACFGSNAEELSPSNTVLAYAGSFGPIAGAASGPEVVTPERQIDPTAAYPLYEPNRPYSDLIERYAANMRISVSLAHAIVLIESDYRPLARGMQGEVGLMQIKPSTARLMGYTGSVSDLFDPETNIKYGMKYLARAQELGDGTICGTILKYNGGHGANRMNPVSLEYCRKVELHLASAKQPRVAGID
jgi:soluble lytic murein transglycosylase-like protein